ncbi:class I SAM-dependent methyltransferase [Actinocorallia sp. A-T 12471]|uniref:class I SAM-dependent methyltransferase n=1 Tax=Actinocorallia sp. A-T 12471 TaxID=3089813 RepID=UPI0029D24EB9|nr:class I SAM-dependent methyltransferase [Actinocorallia sp. A-T 12471]MDX6744958.1 class I SAM-dependent methyltransferase [Actinocorallia sp. A-T 12471]
MAIYDDPEAYELSCAFRDVPAEADALLTWSARHGRRARTVLELAAGPAEHARELVRRGLSCTALDLNAAMCAYAKAKEPRLEVVQADMTDFDLGARFDLVVTMLDSTAHLHTLDALAAHFHRAAAHLAEGGVYILEMSHPSDRLGRGSSTTTSWTTERDGTTADVTWGSLDDPLDPLTQMVDDHVVIRVTEPPTRPGGPYRVRTAEGVVPFRFWTATELQAAVRVAALEHPETALEIVAQYGDFSDIAPTAPEAWRLISVFRRAPDASGTRVSSEHV